MKRTQIYLDADQTPAWQAQWRDALEKTAGVAPYLEEGAEYVEDIRRADAERLARLELRAPASFSRWAIGELVGL